MEENEADLVLSSCSTVFGLQRLSRKCFVVSVVGISACRHLNDFKYFPFCDYILSLDHPALIAPLSWPLGQMVSRHWS